MFVAMNNFKVAPGKGEEFEEIWRTRETYLQDVPGFVRFALLRCEGEGHGEGAGDGLGEYISHSTWQDRAAFTAWMSSDAFVKGHRQGGSLMGVLVGPPQVKLYDAVVEQELATA